ncbi:MAG: hypothetical protein K2K15_05875, partial [Anaeroplasmataceae bacterium]|nr:hypothetical protein [Anaeroplasmataceae bacterium]
IWDLPSNEEEYEPMSEESLQSPSNDAWDIPVEEEPEEEQDPTSLWDIPQEEEQPDDYSFEEREEEEKPTPPREVKITEGERYIVKETKSSLFIREKDPIHEIDEGEDEEEEIPHRQINFYDKN